MGATPNSRSWLKLAGSGLAAWGMDDGETQIFMDRHRGRLLTAIRSGGWVAEFG